MLSPLGTLLKAVLNRASAAAFPTKPESPRCHRFAISDRLALAHPNLEQAFKDLE
jgi:hypothetical protein